MPNRCEGSAGRTAAHDAAAERLWEEVARACQTERDAQARIATAVKASLHFLDAEPACARLLLLEGPNTTSPELAARHGLLLDHLADLLRAARRGTPPAGEALGAGASPERVALQRVFALTAVRLRQPGAPPLADLAPRLAAGLGL